jgi:hypothetical protein
MFLSRIFHVLGFQRELRTSLNKANETLPSEIPPDLRDALKEFDTKADQIIKSFLGTLEAQKPPSIIYHYTNDVGLRGILETGKLWLNDIFDLNDPSELKHGLSLALNLMAADNSPEIKMVGRNLKEFLERVGLPILGHYFICSFSARGDDLGQWRAYADNGRGYALGFDARVLEDAIGKEAGAPILKSFPVTYKDPQLVEIYRELIKNMGHVTALPRQNMGETATREYWAELFTLLVVHALHAGLHFKHEAYSNEEEYRFLQVFPTNVTVSELKRRVRRYSLVKYREFDWKKFAPAALKKIIVGPAADDEKATGFAEDCLKEFQIEQVDLAHSEIPYKAV